MIVNIVKRSFKSYGVFHPVGEIIKDTTTIRNFKTKVSDGKIIQLHDDAPDFVHNVQVLEVKYNVSILAALARKMPAATPTAVAPKTTQAKAATKPAPKVATTNTAAAKPKVAAKTATAVKPKTVAAKQPTANK